MAEGYIKLYRNLLENPVTSKPEMAWLWCVLLLSANHKDVKMIWNGESITIKAGQMITGRKQLSRITGLSESFIYRALKYFESEQQIEQQKNNKFTLITILNWEKYQGNGTTNEQQIEQQMNNQRTTSEQPVNTNKNDKNDKNKDYIAPSNETLPEADTNKNSFPDEPIEEQKPKKAEKISFDFVGEKWTGLKKEHFTNWLEAYPLIDIDRELVKAKEWVLGNLNKSTRKSNWRQFLNNWFSKAQTFEERKVIYAGSYRK
ncbi:MAG: hypothetical protein GX285_02810 [Clostridiales bacterium]|nr:hypothetical protein [Clostridiales bacterium]